MCPCTPFIQKLFLSYLVVKLYVLILYRSCLSAIRTLQKFGHLPSEVEFFKSYAQHGVFRDIRLAAIDAIVDFIKSKYALVAHSFKVYLSLMNGT